jgi:hypothetical protein
LLGGFKSIAHIARSLRLTALFLPLSTTRLVLYLLRPQERVSIAMGDEQSNGDTDSFVEWLETVDGMDLADVDMRSVNSDLSATGTQDVPSLCSSKIVPHRMDVLLGRGRQNIDHPGNAYFICLIEKNCFVYRDGSRDTKKCIAEGIKDRVLQSGRFIKYQKSSSSWVEATSTDITQKIGQAIRYRLNNPPISVSSATHVAGRNSIPAVVVSSPRPLSLSSIPILPPPPPPTRGQLLSDKVILRAIGYDLNEDTGEITRIV